jgi:hypothetical protein
MVQYSGRGLIDEDFKRWVERNLGEIVDIEPSAGFGQWKPDD